MSEFMEINWGEGMFLRPHHLQQSGRYARAALRREVGIARPYDLSFGILQVLDPGQKLVEEFHSGLGRKILHPVSPIDPRSRRKEGADFLIGRLPQNEHGLLAADPHRCSDLAGEFNHTNLLQAAR